MGEQVEAAPPTQWKDTTTHTPGPWVAVAMPYSDGTPYFRIEAGNCGYGELTEGFSFSGIIGTPDARLIVAAPELLEALKTAVKAAEEARREWDAAPNGMKAGKLLIALGGGLPGYRADIDEIHAAIAHSIGATP